MKPKQNYKPGPMDVCGTPYYALMPILPLLTGKKVWESACGQEHLIVNALLHHGINTVASDISSEMPVDFFLEQPESWDVQVTNPPFSQKYRWLKRSYELGKPFALLLPVETIGAGTALRLFRKYGLEVIFFTRRVDFKMPNKGWDSHAQFPVAWFTWGMEVGKPISVYELTLDEKRIFRDVPNEDSGSL